MPAARSICTRCGSMAPIILLCLPVPRVIRVHFERQAIGASRWSTGKNLESCTG